MTALWSFNPVSIVRPVRFGDEAQRRKYLEELRQLSPEGRMAMREVQTLARKYMPPAHIQFAQILAGKYEEIRAIVLRELLAFYRVRKGAPEVAAKAYESRKDFQAAGDEFLKDPEPVVADYQSPMHMSRPEAQAYLTAFTRFAMPHIERTMAELGLMSPRARDSES